MARMSGADRRQQIVEAAIEVILRRGLALAATRDVTRAIGVGSGLLHHYFSSWPELRAEAVRKAARREIDEIKAIIEGMPVRAAMDRIADWVVEDEEMRHWRLWLNAQDEAHRDPHLAEVMNSAMLEWHALIATLLRKAGEETRAGPADPEAAAWRLAALMDGLAGAMLVQNSVMSPKTARDLIGGQFRLECGSSGEI